MKPEIVWIEDKKGFLYFWGKCPICGKSVYSEYLLGRPKKYDSNKCKKIGIQRDYYNRLKADKNKLNRLREYQRKYYLNKRKPLKVKEIIKNENGPTQVYCSNDNNRFYDCMFYLECLNVADGWKGFDCEPCTKYKKEK